MTRIILVDFVTKDHDNSTPIKSSSLRSVESLNTNHLYNQHLFDDQELFQLLCTKMRALSGIGFRYVATIGEGLLSCPWSLTVSHSRQLILVADYYNSRILGFNLYTRELRETIRLTSSPLSICVEKNEDGNDFMIYGTSASEVVKIEIVKKAKPIWKHVVLGYPTGLCVAERQGSNLVFVCDTSSESIIILNSKTGSVINSIRNVQFEIDNPFKKPFAIDITNDGKTLYVSDMNGHCLKTISFKKNIGNNTLEFSQKSFGRGGSSFCGLKLPRGISMSKKRNLIFVCDEANHRVQVFDCRKEEFVNSFGGCGSAASQFRKPYGIFFDDVLEMLYVVDTYNSRIQVFR